MTKTGRSVDEQSTVGPEQWGGGEGRREERRVRGSIGEEQRHGGTNGRSDGGSKGPRDIGTKGREDIQGRERP
jgi:hypothetical protein